MPAPSIYFDPPFDIHLLRGQSLQIVNETTAFATLLRIGRRFAYTYVNDNDSISYNFWTSFDEEKAADFGITVENPVEHDSDFDRKPDFRITLAAAEPVEAHNRIRNFHLFAEVNNAADNSSNWTALRIHIHNALQEVWITPAGLTVNPGVTYQARLHARFDDDVVAEIGNQRQGNSLFNVNNQLTIAWDSPTPNLVDPANGSILAQTITGVHDLNVAVAYNGVTRTTGSLVIISRNLTANSVLQAELVATGGCPGFPRLTEVPNILFLSEGFTREQESRFKNLVTDYVLDLVSKKITAPFNLLKGSINFWMVFVPSRESGATYLGDLAVIKKKNEPTQPKLIGSPIPFIENPETKPIADWGIEHLLYWVGLPVRDERDTADQAVIDDLFAKWEATTNLTDDEIAKLKTNKSLVKKWQRLGERRLPDAKDTAFGVTIKDTTAARKENDFSEINLDPKRIQRRDLDAFFSTLRDEDNNLIGPTFIKHISPTQPAIGKDWDNIVILTAVRRGRALNSSGYMFTVLEKTNYAKTTETLIGDLTALHVPIAPTDLPDKLPVDAKATTTHELCHSFGIEDEYGEKPPSDSYVQKPVNDPLVSGWSFAKYGKAASAVDWSSNVQARKDLEVPVSTGGSQIQPYKIKWRYHRIQKCGIVTAIAVTGSQIVLTVQGGQAAQFTVNKPVFLRKRRRHLTVYSLFSPTDGATSTLATIVSPDPVPNAFVDRVEITAIDAATDSVTLTHGADTLIVTVEHGQAASLQTGEGFAIRADNKYDPVIRLFRTADTLTKAMSPELTVASVDPASNTLTLTIPAGVTLPDYMRTVHADEAMLVYEPIAMPEGQRSADYPYAEIISQRVLNRLLVDPNAFNADNEHREMILSDTKSEYISDLTNIPNSLVPCCTRREKEIIGLYSGGDQAHSDVYHPAANCMMRRSSADGHYTELCAVCRYTLINQIDPTKHADFDTDYMKRKIYPD